MLYLSLSHLRSDGFRDFMEQGNTRPFSNAGYRLSDDLETRFYLTHGDINREIPGNVRHNHQRDYAI